MTPGHVLADLATKVAYFSLESVSKLMIGERGVERAA